MGYKLLNDVEQNLVKCPVFVLCVFVENFVENLVSLTLMVTKTHKYCCENDFVFTLTLDWFGLVSTLKLLRVRTLIPQFKKFGAVMVLHGL